MPRPQFTLRALLVVMLAVACFFGGIRFERERRRREDEATGWLIEPIHAVYFSDLRDMLRKDGGLAPPASGTQEGISPESSPPKDVGSGARQ